MDSQVLFLCVALLLFSLLHPLSLFLFARVRARIIGRGSGRSTRMWSWLSRSFSSESAGSGGGDGGGGSSGGDDGGSRSRHPPPPAPPTPHAAALHATPDPTSLSPPPTPPFHYSRLDAAEKLEVPPSSDFFAPDADEEDGMPPRYALILHHPERQNGTVPVRTGGTGASAAIAVRAAAMGVSAERAQMQVDELRQFKALCDRLLPGLRTQSHLYTLIHLCDRTHTVTLSEFGEVIGGATFRIIQSDEAGGRFLLLEVLLLAVEQRAGVCGKGHGTRIVNFLKRLALLLAARRGVAAGLITQSDCQPELGGGAARQFWARQRLRATPQATLLTRALHQWDHANEVYAHAVPMLCWLDASTEAASVAAHDSERAQRQAPAGAREAFRHTRHTNRVTVKLKGAMDLLPPIESTSPVLPVERSPSAGGAGGAESSGRHRGERSAAAAMVVIPPPLPKCAVRRPRHRRRRHPAAAAEATVADWWRRRRRRRRRGGSREASPTRKRRAVGGAPSAAAPLLECRRCSRLLHAKCDRERARLPSPSWRSRRRKRRRRRGRAHLTAAAAPAEVHLRCMHATHRRQLRRPPARSPHPIDVPCASPGGARGNAPAGGSAAAAAAAAAARVSTHPASAPTASYAARQWRVCAAAASYKEDRVAAERNAA